MPTLDKVTVRVSSPAHVQQARDMARVQSQCLQPGKRQRRGCAGTEGHQEDALEESDEKGGKVCSLYMHIGEAMRSVRMYKGMDMSAHVLVWACVCLCT